MTAYTYRILTFDTEPMPIYNPVSNMGTGAALTSYSQLPLRGYYDNYGSNRAPQGIRDVTYDCWIIETTDDARRQALDALRAKIGVRGKLSIIMDAGDDLRWQWARLVDVDAPQSWAETTWLPVSLTFRTSSQYWYGIITTGTEWVWGDSTWTFGDGTAEFGEQGTLETLTATGATGTPPGDTLPGTTQAFTFNNAGNREAVNPIVTVRAGTSTITALRWANATSGYSWYVTGITVAVNTVLVVDCGGMSVTNAGANAYSLFTPSDKTVWDQFEAGDNAITVYVTGNATANGTIAVEFYDHWA